VTAASLKQKPVRDLARLAKQHGVAGWHAMRKDQLIRALVRKARARQPVPAAAMRPKLAPPRPAPAEAVPARDAAVAQRIQEARERLAKAKILATKPEHGRASGTMRDRIVAMVRGPHWIHAFWEITSASIVRARAALGQEWHAAKPTLRVLQLENSLQASPSERVVRAIEVHGGVKNWFIDIRDPLRCRVEIGYLTPHGRFHALARSNAVNVPGGSQSDTLDTHWGDIASDCEKIYSLSGGFSPEHSSTDLQELFEEKLRRPIGPPAARHSAVDGEFEPDDSSEFQIEVDAEMIVYGATQPGAYVTLQGEPVKVGPDGTFRVRVDLPNKRQVLPIVASNPNGLERQTVVIAVERNTKTMEAIGRDVADA
jgi:hypothetical protein